MCNRKAAVVKHQSIKILIRLLHVTNALKIYIKLCQNIKIIFALITFQIACFIIYNGVPGEIFHILDLFPSIDHVLISLSLCFLFSASIPFRLAGGSDSHEGRLEVFFQNQWGSVCTGSSTAYLKQVSDALCRRLGFAAAVSDSTSDFGTTKGPVWADSFPPRWCETLYSDPLICVEQWGSFDENICRNDKNDITLVCNST